MPETVPQSSHQRILKSSAIVAAASAGTLVFGIIKTKAFALLLGPPGVGAMGLYQSVANVLSTLSAFGIGNSGVREIAAAQRTGDPTTVARRIVVLRRVSLILGCSGLLALAILHEPISALSFGRQPESIESGHRGFLSRPSSATLILSIAVLFAVLSGAQSALIQGRRRISDLAKARLSGALLGTTTSVALVWWLGGDGVVLAIVVTAAMGLASSWWYAREPRLGTDSGPAWRETWKEAQSLLKGGGAFMTSVLSVSAIAYLARVLVVRQLGLEAAGFYTAAVALAGLYVGFLTQAMGADFFPTLSERSEDNNSCNTLVNEQTEVALLMAAPGLMLTFAACPLVIKTFYSAEFLAAVPLVYWLLLGVFVQMISWPLGYLLLAKANAASYTRSVLAANCLHALLLPLAIRYCGLVGAGIASLFFEIAQLALLYFAARRTTGFSWASSNVRLAALLACCLALVAIFCITLPGTWTVIAGIAGTAATAFYAIMRLAPYLRHIIKGIVGIGPKPPDYL
jgi:PST family polysaccharide transporter